MFCFLFLGASSSPSQPNVAKRKKLPVDSVFNKFEDEDSDEVPRKRKLVPLDYGDDDKSSAKNNVNTEEKRKHIKSLIEKIPTAKPELFAYPLDWSIVDTVSVFFCFQLLIAIADGNLHLAKLSKLEISTVV